MPAITADTLTLPRIAAAGRSDTERPVRSVKSEVIEALEDYTKGKFGAIRPDALMPYRV